MNLGSFFLEKAAAQFPDTVSVVTPEARLTNQMLYQRACRLANALLGLGLKKGTRVAVLLTNSHQSVECFLGLACGGLALVPMNARNSAQEHAYIIDNSDAEAVIVGKEFIDSILSIRDQIPKATRFIGVGSDLPSTVRDYEQLMADAPPEPPDIDVTEADIASIRYTAGTTGKPKACCIPLAAT